MYIDFNAPLEYQFQCSIVLLKIGSLGYRWWVNRRATRWQIEPDQMHSNGSVITIPTSSPSSDQRSTQTQDTLCSSSSSPTGSCPIKTEASSHQQIIAASFENRPKLQYPFLNPRTGSPFFNGVGDRNPSSSPSILAAPSPNDSVIVSYGDNSK
ncbi:hypothetical protein ACLOJK_034481, partial [Asimina triloba]